MSRLVGFAGIAVLVISGVFSLLGYTKISYIFLAVAAVDLMVARIYQPDESNDRRTKQLKAVSCFFILLGTLFIYITGSWIGIIAIFSGIIDLMSGEFSILKKQRQKL
ncbi:hypothetical protein RAE06_11595 [Corynebacterium tuberculostearicum]|uniref:hypothetical protein n=1 Tax=Corynebacterium tuberculostearicum TaxID=38304 RepID=UPI00195A3DE6|nr:hypothetical protein [Corynebacterium tuberculostearicum]MDV2429511.1 hypothetical protein [Corynebacterium tuberculostearicum]QRQ67970.1 hypothetical protein I6J28_04525 [Corynebacterium tuberculostearicum]